MQNEIVIIAPTEPTAISHDLDRRLSIFSNALERRGLQIEIAEDRAPSAEDRGELAHREAQISCWMEPAGSSSARKEVYSILVTMPRRAADEFDTKAALAIYGADLADLPLFALAKACAAFRQGRAGDGHWAPTQAEIRTKARGYTQPLEMERAKIRAVLDAEILDPDVSEARREQASQWRAEEAEEELARAPNPERRERVARHVKDTLAMLKMARPRNECKDDEKRPDPETPEQALVRLSSEIKTNGLPGLSDELRGTLGHRQDGGEGRAFVEPYREYGNDANEVDHSGSTRWKGAP